MSSINENIFIEGVKIALVLCVLAIYALNKPRPVSTSEHRVESGFLSIVLWIIYVAASIAFITQWAAQEKMTLNDLAFAAAMLSPLVLCALVVWALIGSLIIAGIRKLVASSPDVGA